MTPSLNPSGELHSKLERIGRAFGIPGDFVSGAPFGNGLINDTFAATFADPDGHRRFILQRINHHVFRDPVSLMGNVERVCRHMRERLQADGEPNAHRKALTMLQTGDGSPLHLEPHPGEENSHTYWRCFVLIEGCTSHEVVESPELAYEAARQFGRFQRLVTDLPGDRLIETIPDFHHTPKRFDALQAAIRRDSHGRAAECAEEIAFALSRESVAHHLLGLHAKGLIPERITHNDTKLANVLIDDQTGRGICVVDLDTVMPGLSLYDFGDLVRSCVSPVEEDSTELDAIDVRPEVFEALASGFLDQMADILTPVESENLAFAGKLLTYEVGLRFLTDYLSGDVYFATKRPRHNLERARNQLQLVRRLEETEPAMRRRIADLSPGLTVA
jgi:hypothetical protein